MRAQAVAANSKANKIDVLTTKILTAVPPLLLRNKKGTQEAQKTQESSQRHAKQSA